MVDSKQQWKAWIYLSPALVLLLIFTVYPIFNTIRLSFLDGYNIFNAIGGQQYTVGFGNFKKVLEYQNFLNCMKTTFLLTIITVPISTMLALLIAVSLNSIKFVQKTLQTIFFIPYVTNAIAIGMVFGMMFNIIGIGNQVVSPGIVNVLLGKIDNPIHWIDVNSSYTANIAVMVFYIVWKALPFKILILIGGLQNISKQYYDAAKMDSASKWRVLWRITVPLVSPMLAYVIITSFIGGFKEYTSIVGVFGADMGPTGDSGRLNTIVGFIYDAITTGSTGRASAAALILFVIILIITLINLQISKKKVHYS